MSHPNTAAAAPSTYFASGSNRVPEIRGLNRIGHPIGVAADEMTANAEAELVKVSVPVFVDSGAYSEVEFTDDGPIVVRPMTHEMFVHVLSLYLRLATELGSQLYVVAPDMVGHQAETLERLRRYAPAVRQLRELGVNILVCVQRGAMSQAEFDAACSEVLGFDDYIRALPCKKAATSAAEVDTFVKAVRPARLHLLGLGITNDEFEAYRAAATQFGAELTCDSCLIRGTTGKSNGRDNHPAERGPNHPDGQGPRVYTKAQYLAREIIAEELTDIRCHRELGMVLAFSPISDESRRWELIEAKLEARRARLELAA